MAFRSRRAATDLGPGYQDVASLNLHLVQRHGLIGGGSLGIPRLDVKGGSVKGALNAFALQIPLRQKSTGVSALPANGANVAAYVYKGDHLSPNLHLLHAARGNLIRPSYLGVLLSHLRLLLRLGKPWRRRPRPLRTGDRPYYKAITPYE